MTRNKLVIDLALMDISKFSCVVKSLYKQTSYFGESHPTLRKAGAGFTKSLRFMFFGNPTLAFDRLGLDSPTIALFVSLLLSGLCKLSLQAESRLRRIPPQFVIDWG